jgi:hypothetical protein
MTQNEQVEFMMSLFSSPSNDTTLSEIYKYTLKTVKRLIRSTSIRKVHHNIRKVRSALSI